MDEQLRQIEARLQDVQRELMEKHQTGEIMLGWAVKDPPEVRLAQAVAELTTVVRNLAPQVVVASESAPAKGRRHPGGYKHRAGGGTRRA